jgi:hypothetical protein
MVIVESQGFHNLQIDEEKRPLGKAGNKLKNNIRIKYVRCKSADWIELAHNRM